MANSKLSELKGILGLGARTNKYKVQITWVSGKMIDTLCKSTTIPTRSFHEIEIWNQGRLTVIAGDADFSGTWSCTFMDDEEHTLRGKFLEWMEFIDSSDKHSRGAGSHSDYMSTAILQQLNTSTNCPTATYTFEDVWIKDISDSSVSDDSSETIIEFTVEFQYTLWKKS